MKFGGTKSYWAVFVVFLILVCSSIGQTQKQQDCRDGRGGGNPPWFNPAKKCDRREKPYHYHAAGGIYINQEQRHCKEVILICGTTMVRESDVNKDPGCGGAFWPDPKDGDEVCCEDFQKAIQSKQPCDPSKDADCDGIPNEKDPNPFKQSCDPCSGTNVPIDVACSQLGEDVAKAYREAGASGNTAEAAGTQAIKDCAKKKCEAKNNPNHMGPERARVTPCLDNVSVPKQCCDLFGKVSQAYLNAGASIETALDAGDYAMLECEKKNPKKK